MVQATCARSGYDLGYENVYVMPDGIAGWEKAKLPVETVSARRCGG